MFKFSRKEKTPPQNIQEILNVLRDLEKKLEKTDKELKSLQKESKLCLQKIGIVRFNPFSEVGGDQSFSIALLDNNDDGLVITSLYSRGENRVYAKPIKNGNSKYVLSSEEKNAIDKARQEKEYDEKTTQSSDSSNVGTH
ncbi:MAG: DUF4446 family protein [Patescibacteria group bacterium]